MSSVTFKMRKGVNPLHTTEEGNSESTLRGGIAKSSYGSKRSTSAFKKVDARKLSREYLTKRGLGSLSFDEKTTLIQKYKLGPQFDTWLKDVLKIKDRHVRQNITSIRRQPPSDTKSKSAKKRIPSLFITL